MLVIAYVLRTSELLNSLSKKKKTRSESSFFIISLDCLAVPSL